MLYKVQVGHSAEGKDMKTGKEKWARPGPACFLSCLMISPAIPKQPCLPPPACLFAASPAVCHSDPIMLAGSL